MTTCNKQTQIWAMLLPEEVARDVDLLTSYDNDFVTF